MITDMESATLGLPDSMESKHPLAEDHFGVIKFDGACSPGYVQATSRLQDMLGNAGKQVRARSHPLRKPNLITITDRPLNARMPFMLLLASFKGQVLPLTCRPSMAGNAPYYGTATSGYHHRTVQTEAT